MDSGIDYPWIGEMFICIIHRIVQDSWINKMQNSIMYGYCKMNLVEYIMCKQSITHR